MPGTVVVVESNRAGNGARAVLLAQSWGYHTMFVCRDPAEYAVHDQDVTEMADETVVVDTLDPRWLLHHFNDKHIVAVVAYDEPSLMTAATCASTHSQNPTPRIGAIARTRFKHLMRKALDKTPYAIPWAVVSTEEPISESPIGFPCVVKPMDLGGNYAVSICTNGDEYRRALRHVAATRTQGYGRYTPLQSALVEKYLYGPEYSVEMAWNGRESRWAVIGITDKTTIDAANPLESRHIFPAPLLAEAAEILTRTATTCLALLRLRHTVVHAEFKVTSDGVFPIEVNCRPAGGHINDLVHDCFGQDLIETHLRVALNDPSALDAYSMPTSRAAGIQYLVPEAHSSVDTIQLPAALPAGVTKHIGALPKKIGDLNSDSRLGYFKAVAPDADTVSRLLDMVLDSTKIGYARRGGTAI